MSNLERRLNDAYRCWVEQVCQGKTFGYGAMPCYPLGICCRHMIYVTRNTRISCILWSERVAGGQVAGASRRLAMTTGGCHLGAGCLRVWVAQLEARA